MGCFASKEAKDGQSKDARDGRITKYGKPVWKSEESITAAELRRRQDEFWDTAPHYGGRKEIWDALKLACESDLETAKAVIQAAGIIVAAEDMTCFYDERGAKYDLPKYVVSAPTNLA